MRNLDRWECDVTPDAIWFRRSATGKWVSFGDVEKLQQELDAWWDIAKDVLEDTDNTLCDESRQLLEGIVYKV